MFKKSHALSTAGILLLAVLFVLAGCQNPEAPVVNQGDTSVQFPEFPDQVGPSEVSVTTTNTGPEAKLPAGLVYPGDGAKVLSGNALDITQAFNGGILVADTSDASGGSVVPSTSTGSNQGGGNAYIQEGVDQILWTGIGTKSGALGVIVVPPGKTLFIGGDLVINGDAPSSGSNTFAGVRVLDKGGYAAAAGEEPSLSILAATGANVGSGDSAGKIVFLAGSNVTVVSDTTAVAAGTFTIGGDLEIHRGATVNLTGGDAAYKTPFVATEGSVIDVYGNLALGAEGTTTALPNVINGKLTIKAGATVSAAADTGGLTFGDDVVLEGNLALPAAGNVVFDGNLIVGENTGLTLTSNTSTTFNKKATFNGYLNLNAASGASAANYAVGPSGELVITKTGLIGNGLWLGNAAQLIGAFKADKADTENARVIFEDPGEAAYNLNLALSVGNFADLKALAAHDNLRLASLTYAYTGAAPETFSADEELLVTKGNYVVWDGSPLPPKVTVKDGGSIKLGAVNDAGAITLIGNGREAYALGIAASNLAAAPLDVSAAPFATKLTTLTIGDGSVETSVEIGAISTGFAPKTGEIIVEKNAELTVGVTGIASIDIPGKIILKAGDDGAGNGGKFLTTSLTLPNTNYIASFNSTKEIDIGKEALFDAGASGDFVTFAGLEKLTVNGTLRIASTGTDVSATPPTALTAALFDTLQTKVSANQGTSPNYSASTPDVAGDGTAVFEAWKVVGDKDHAFDQILGIKTVVVASVAGVPNTSGFEPGYTKDRGDTKKTGHKLVVGAIAVPDTGLTVDRDLDVRATFPAAGIGTTVTLGAGTITFPATPAGRLTISAGKTISAAGGEVLVADTASATLTDATTTATVLTATSSGLFTQSVGGLTLTIGNTLKIPRQLSLGASTSFTAGGTTDATGKVVLTGAASGAFLKNVTIAPPPSDSTGSVTLTIGESGALSNGGASTVGKGSGISAANGSKIISVTGGTLAFGISGAVIGAGTLEAVGNSAGIKTVAVYVAAGGGGTPPVVPGKAELSGEWKALGGASVLTAGSSSNAGELTIASGAGVTVAVGGSDYDTVKLAGSSTLTGGVVFNATTGKITLGSAGALTNGTLTTVGKGVLEFATDTTLVTAGENLTIGATLVTGGIQQGSLNLSKGTLALATGFAVGTSSSVGDATATAPALATLIALNVSEAGKIVNNKGVAITLLANAADTDGNYRKGQLSFNGYTLAGVVSGAELPDALGKAANQGNTTTKTVVTLNDLHGEFGVATTATPNPGVDATGGEGWEVDVASGAITITGSIASNGEIDTITAKSELYTTDL